MKGSPDHSHIGIKVSGIWDLVHDDVMKWKNFPRYWPLVWGIHRSPVNSPHKGQWHGTLMLSLICFWINGWVNNREAGDLRRYRAHYDVSVMMWPSRYSAEQNTVLIFVKYSLAIGYLDKPDQTIFSKMADEISRYLVVLQVLNEAFMLLEGVILGLGSANKGWRHNVTSSVIGWAHNQIDPCICPVMSPWCKFQ